MGQGSRDSLTSGPYCNLVSEGGMTLVGVPKEELDKRRTEYERKRGQEKRAG